VLVFALGAKGGIASSRYRAKENAQLMLTPSPDCAKDKIFLDFLGWMVDKPNA
jgi:hypothetical protein